MALCRCEAHGVIKGKKHTYLSYALPLGYPETAVICGTVGCESPARVMLNEDERKEHQAGSRIFGVNTGTLKIRVEDNLHMK